MCTITLNETFDNILVLENILSFSRDIFHDKIMKMCDISFWKLGDESYIFGDILANLWWYRNICHRRVNYVLQLEKNKGKKKSK